MSDQQGRLAGAMPLRWVIFGVLLVGLLSLGITAIADHLLSGLPLILASVAGAFGAFALLIAIFFRGARGMLFVKWLAFEAAIAAVIRIAAELGLGTRIANG